MLLQTNLVVEIPPVDAELNNINRLRPRIVVLMKRQAVGVSWQMRESRVGKPSQELIFLLNSLANNIRLDSLHTPAEFILLCIARDYGRCDNMLVFQAQ